MSTCPRCYEDMGCTCREHDRIAELEAKLAEKDADIVRHKNTIYYRAAKFKQLLEQIILEYSECPLCHMGEGHKEDCWLVEWME